MPVGTSRLVGPLGAVRRRTTRYDATRRAVKTAAAANWYGNSGTPPPDVLDVVLVEVEEDEVEMDFQIFFSCKLHNLEAINLKKLQHFVKQF